MIAWVTTAIFVLITFIGEGRSTYRFAIFFLAPLLWGVYFFRDRLHLHPCHFAIFAAALVLHNLGAFGTYGKFYAGLEFDTYVHFFFGVAGGFVVARALKHCYDLRDWKLWVGTVLVILGMGAFHELIEYGSTLVLGGEKGMLKTNDPDQFDTQKDLWHNLLGSLLALTLYSIGSKIRQQKKAAHKSALSEPAVRSA